MPWLAGAAALLLLVLSRLTGGMLGWGMGVPLAAVTSCPAVYLRNLAALGLLLGLLALAGRFRPRLLGGAALAAAAALAWALRERNFLLGDSRMWLENMRWFGADIGPYREPLAIKLVGFLSTLATGPEGQKAILGALSVLSGAAAAAAVARSVPAAVRGRLGAGTALVFLAPLGFLFYGHIEIYPVFTALMAWTLVAVGGDMDRGRLRPVTAALLVLLPFMHYMAALLVVPFAGWLVARRRPGTRGWLAGGGAAVTLLAAAVLFVPSVRALSVLSTSWNVRRLLSYLEDAGNGWFAVLVPVGVLAWAVRRRALATPYGKFLALAGFTYLLLPLGGRFELGVYRDFGLLAPAFVTWTLFAARGLDPERGARQALLAGAAGAPLLAGWLALGACEGGAAFLETQIERPEFRSEARAYSYEVLAYERHGAGDARGALRAMERAVAATPGNPRLYGPLGEFQLDVGDTAAALPNLERSLGTGRAFKSMATLLPLLVRRGEMERALRIASAHRGDVLATSQSTAAVAVAYLRAGYPDSTVLVCQERLARDPEDHVAFFNAGAGLAATGRLEEALGAFQEAAALVPGNAAYHRAVIAVLKQFPDGTERIAAYLRSLPPALADSLWRQR